jgi:hypothetical protein
MPCPPPPFAAIEQVDFPVISLIRAETTKISLFGQEKIRASSNIFPVRQVWEFARQPIDWERESSAGDCAAETPVGKFPVTGNSSQTEIGDDDLLAPSSAQESRRPSPGIHWPVIPAGAG